MPTPRFRGASDPDERRKEILWTAISFIVIFASWLAVVLVFGFRPLILGMTYDEAVLITGLGLLVLCSVLYLIGRERDQRYTNRRLVTELHATVARLDERLGQLNELCIASAELAGSLDIDNIAQCVVNALRDIMAADRSWLILVDGETGQAVYARQSYTESFPHEAAAPDPQHVWPAPLSADGDRLTDLGAQIHTWNQIPALICVPLRLKSGLVGVLAARRPEGALAFTPDDQSMLSTLANMAAKALESGQLHSELRESYLVTVRSLVRSLDARDNYAASHGQRVAALAVRLAEHMGLPETTISDIEVFAPLHDVGKIGIRDAILLKSGPLTQEEKAICREHCLIGDRIVRPLKPTRGALALVRNHHESWDGRGYPDGLAGLDIPVPARIVRVADCFDALIAERPYGYVINEEEALAHFHLRAGIDYDPAIVEALEAVLHGDSTDRERSAPQAVAPAARLASASVATPAEAVTADS